MTSAPISDRHLVAVADSATSNATATQQFRLTDLGNAERLVDEHGPDLLRVAGDWLAWDGRRYDRDETGARAMQLQKRAVRGMYTEAAQLDDADERKRLAEHAARSESERALRAALNLAASDPAVIADPDTLDADPMLLNVTNGALELDTGTLREHRRDDRCTLAAGAPYDPDAKCPRWLAVLGRIFANDAELIDFIRRAFGYMLTGRTDEQILFLLHGNGANGKSVLLAILRALLGDYARNTPASTLLERRNGGDSIPNDLARLRGVRAVTAAETGDGRRLDEERVKALTGSDVISARFMRGEWFDFQPVFKLALATNHLPVIRGTDHAMWRRVRLIPFTVTIPDDEQDRTLTGKLLDELPGILTWAVTGCLDWQRHGLQAPDAVMAATASYREESDTLGQFIDDACELHPDATENAAQLYTAYSTWCEINGERFPLTQTAFGRRLTERDIPAHRTGAQRLRRGITLRTANP
jgi:putative DNA primase/helicase